MDATLVAADVGLELLRLIPIDSAIEQLLEPVGCARPREPLREQAATPPHLLGKLAIRKQAPDTIGVRRSYRALACGSRACPADGAAWQPARAAVLVDAHSRPARGAVRSRCRSGSDGATPDQRRPRLKSRPSRVGRARGASI